MTPTTHQVPVRLLALGWLILLLAATGTATAAEMESAVALPQVAVAAVPAPLPAPEQPPAPAPAPQAAPPPPPAVALPEVPVQAAPHKAATRKAATRPAAALPAAARPAPQPAPPAADPAPLGPTGPTSWPELNAAIARLPGYDGRVTWRTDPNQAEYGVADWYDQLVTVSTRVPTRRLDDIVRHEWSHLLSVRPYDDVEQATTAMGDWYSSADGLDGAERAADCMALQLGARWTHYTDCADPQWQEGARRLLSGQRLA